MTVAQRVCWLLLFAFWQGGFMFYGAVVVPISTSVLGSEQEQGFVTRSVTNYLNLTGGIVLVLWCCELALSHDHSQRRYRLRWTLLLTLLVLLGALLWLHLRMDECLDLERQTVRERQAFRSLHSAYLIISTIQWALSCLLLVVTLGAWHDQKTKRIT